MVVCLEIPSGCYGSVAAEQTADEHFDSRFIQGISLDESWDSPTPMLTCPRAFGSGEPSPTFDLSPSLKMFFAALMSRSWWHPHFGQFHSRTSSGILSTINPHLLHVLDDGKYLSTFPNTRPYHPHLYSILSTNSLGARSINQRAACSVLRIIFEERSSV